MQKDFVIVTSLYNLTNVKRTDNRDWNDYLRWFEKTLQVKCPFIIFTEEEIKPFILEQRKNLLTHVITTKLEDVPLFSLKDKIQDILDSSEYQEKMSDVDRVECKDSLYSVIQYSKFKWLKKASELNPFDSKYFFWLDAGASRFLEDSYYQNSYPSQESLDQLDLIDNTFLLQYNFDYYTDLINCKSLSKKYFFDNRSFICGSMFGGNIEAINSIDNEMDKIMSMMIENTCINNEQIALGYLCKNKEELFTKFYRKDSQKHLNLFEEMV